MKKYIITLFVSLMTIFSYGQSVYMHEAQQEAEENGISFGETILGAILFFGVIYVISKLSYRKSDSEHNHISNINPYDYSMDEKDWEEEERQEREWELKSQDIVAEYEANQKRHNITDSFQVQKDLEKDKTMEVSNTKSKIISNHSTNESHKANDNTINTVVNAVDLGLSVLWADCNIGASKPEEYGRYIEWGAIVPGEKRVYPRQTHPLHKANLQELQSILNNEDGSISGNLTYDIAAQNIGNGWRIPTRLELEELIAKCKWERTTHNNTKGIKFVGPNGNQIFIPCAGHWIVDNAAFTEEDMAIWSATPYTGSVQFSKYNPNQILFANYMCVRLKATFGDKPTITTVQRDMAMTIRAVKDK